MVPVALDLFKGLGGATRGLKRAGFWVVGVDNEDYSGFKDYVEPGHFIQADIRTFDPRKHLGPMKVDFVWASPPCQEFSYRSFPFKRCRYLRDNVPPDTSLWEASLRIAKELDAPIVIENVRGAERYMGKAKAHYGSFYLWGDVPVLLPIGRPVKGFQQVERTSRGKKGPLNALRTTEFRGNTPKKGFAGEYERDNGIGKKMVGSEKYKIKLEDLPHSGMDSKSQSRKEWSAKVAMIPEELSYWIAKCFLPNQTEG